MGTFLEKFPNLVSHLNENSVSVTAWHTKILARNRFENRQKSFRMTI